MQTDYETLRKRYDSLLDRQEQLARVQASAAGLDRGIFQIVDSPNQPQVPVGPNRFKYKMFALALALGLGLLIAILIEVPRLYSITDDRDVEYYLGVPVIALIPEAVSPVDGQPRRLLVGKVVGVLILAGVICAALILLNYMQVFTHAAALIH